MKATEKKKVTAHTLDWIKARLEGRKTESIIQDEINADVWMAANANLILRAQTIARSLPGDDHKKARNGLLSALRGQMKRSVKYFNEWSVSDKEDVRARVKGAKIDGKMFPTVKASPADPKVYEVHLSEYTEPGDEDAAVKEAFREWLKNPTANNLKAALSKEIDNYADLIAQKSSKDNAPPESQDLGFDDSEELETDDIPEELAAANG